MLGPEDLPAVIIDFGDEPPDTLGGKEGGERLLWRRVQVDVLVVLDAEHRELSR